MIAFIAQDMPLYRNLSVGDMVHLTRNLNVSFDTAYVRRRPPDLGISGRHKAGKLSRCNRPNWRSALRWRGIRGCSFSTS